MKKYDMPYAESMLVTVDKAKEWLAVNIKCNRALSNVTVDYYLAIMKRGEWNERNGETIKFDEQGNLIDGQHRLSAQVLFGKPLWYLVAFNCSTTAFMSIDCGKARSGADSLSIREYNNCNVLAGALTLLWRYHGGFMSSGMRVTNAAIASMAEAHSGMSDSASFACSVRGPKGFLAPSIVAFLHYMAKRRTSKEKADAFIKAVMAGEHCDNDSAMRVLRQRLVDNIASKAKLRRTDVVAICIKAWNFYISGLECTPNKLRFRTNGDAAEAYPKFAA